MTVDQRPDTFEHAVDADPELLSGVGVARDAAGRGAAPGVEPGAAAAREADPRDAGPRDTGLRGTAAGDAAEAGPSAARRRWRLPLLAGGVVVALVAGLGFWLQGGRYETTDDAAVQAGLGAVAANVGGPVVAIAVHENERVHAGQVLFRIDPAPYQAAVDEAAAALADARAQVAAIRAGYRQGEAELAAAQGRLAYATAEAARQQALFAEGIASRAQADQARLAVVIAQQAIATDRAKNAGTAAPLHGSASAPTDSAPAVQAALARLARARLDLGYTVVRAAQDGIVTRVDQLQPGDAVAAGKPVFTLAGTRIWVEANFKENQLDHMRVGQPATLDIDAFPDLHLTGHVRSFSPGTGNSFALLPAENATGNWVKVAQRLPVEVSIDHPPADLPLHAGLSVTVTVDTGHRRHLFGANGTAPAAAATVASPPR